MVTVRVLKCEELLSPLKVNPKNIVRKEIYMNLIKEGTNDQCWIVFCI
jgi:hypothetical protein